MESSLHRQLKAHYAPDVDDCEVTIDGYRIDAVCNGRLIEIQYASLGAIRSKIAQLLMRYDVTVVKPLAGRKYLVKRARKNGKVQSARYSPTKKTFHHVFEDLVHFVDVFPHPRLTLEVLLTEQEEHRLPARRRTWRNSGCRVTDRFLRSVDDSMLLRTSDDLLAMLPTDLPSAFTTEELAKAASIPRWLAQKMAYCLRKTGAATTVGKCGNAWLYEAAAAPAKPRELKPPATGAKRKRRRKAA